MNVDLIKYYCEECNSSFYIEDEGVSAWYCVFCGSSDIGQLGESEE